MPYILTTESTVDLSAERLQALGVPVIRMEYAVDGGEPQLDDMSEDCAFIRISIAACARAASSPRRS